MVVVVVIVVIVTTLKLQRQVQSNNPHWGVTIKTHARQEPDRQPIDLIGIVQPQIH